MTQAPDQSAAGSPAATPDSRVATAVEKPSAPAEAANSARPVGFPRVGTTSQAEPQPTLVETSTLTLVDTLERREHRTRDLLFAGVCALGLVTVFLLAVFAQATTTAVIYDVQTVFSQLLRRVLVFPLQAFEGIVTLALPLALMGRALLHKDWWRSGQALIALISAYLLSALFTYLLQLPVFNQVHNGMISYRNLNTYEILSPTYAALAAVILASGKHQSKLVKTSWWLLGIVVGVSVLRSAITLLAAVASVLLGLIASYLVLYIMGVASENATGVALARGLRRCGVDAVKVVRLNPCQAPLQAWQVRTDSQLGYTEKVRENPIVSTQDDGAVVEAETPQTLAPAGNDEKLTPLPDYNCAHELELAEELWQSQSEDIHRIYAVWDQDGKRYDLSVMDTDTHVVGFLSTAWDTLRTRGLAPAKNYSVRASAENTVMMNQMARSRAVRSPQILGVAEAEESMLLVTEHIVSPRSFGQLGDQISDDTLLDLWTQLRRAHTVGLAHRAISDQSVLVDAGDHIWLTDWDDGELASSELSRRMDLAQTLALVALNVGVERAIASASRVLDRDQVASIAPMLQKVVLPRSTRAAMGRRGKILQELRDALVALVPTAQAEPTKINRFSARTIFMAIVGVVALWTVLGQMNFTQISAAVEQANFWWFLAALVFSLATYVGAGMTLVAFTPNKLGLIRATEVHFASSVVALVAPAGVGGAAMNLRFLNRKGVPTAVGVATVALVQVSQFVVTVVLLGILAATTGTSSGLSLPSGWVLVAVVVAVVVAAVALAVPQLRNWIWVHIEPTVKQVWPRLVWLASNPTRMGVGVLGTVILSLAYILSFGASLWAFGYSLPFAVLAITYLASNTVGSVVPSPGGLGPVELALTGGLVTAGVPSGVAVSAVLVYRLVTFWIPIPLGYLSLQRLQKRGDL